MSLGRQRGALAVELLRAGIGVAHLLGSRHALGRPAVLARVLGVRQLVQAGLVLRAGSASGSGAADAHTVSALVDATHGVTMVPLALLDRQSRRFAVRQLWIAVLLTVLEVALVGPGRKLGPGRKR
jgi:hypothetical protein